MQATEHFFLSKKHQYHLTLDSSEQYKGMIPFLLGSLNPICDTIVPQEGGDDTNDFQLCSASGNWIAAV